MKIYLIEAKDRVSWDSYDAHVVIAASAKAARKLCKSADEGPIWTDKSKSTCRALGLAGSSEEEVVLSSFNAG